MPKKVGPQDFDVTLKYGGGLHTRASEEDILDREAAGGGNFQLDLENKHLRPRAPFDLLGTAPNGQSILGGGSLLKDDGTVAAFFQAGTKVYKWDGTSFTASPVLATVSSTAKLRGRWREHMWTLSNKLLITDLSLVEVVKEWDGTTWANTTFKSGPSTAFGTFYAKYCQIADERAMFGNVRDPSTTTHHMLVGSKRSDYTTISNSTRPSSSANAADPWFMLSPDLKPINGMVDAFGTMIFSTEQGRLFRLTGSDATNFAIGDFYPGSAASGAESLAYIGNDIIYGRKGRIESVNDTNRFGDSEASDLTRQIADQIEDYTGWTTVYNSRLHRVYLFPTGQSEVWVFQVSMRDDGSVSPWMRWTTSHSLAFEPTFVMSMLDPADGLEYVFMGDSSGRIYRLEGTGTAGDGGNTNISTVFLSKMQSISLDGEAFDIEGYVKYRKNSQAATVDLNFEYAGDNIFNQGVEISIPAAAAGAAYGGQYYYGDGTVYGSISGRLSRQKFTAAGRSTDFQVRTTVTGTADFSISEIGLRFTAAS